MTANSEELIEQAYFFRVVRERIEDAVPMQELLLSVKDEVLATTRLPMAIDFLVSELRHLGVMATAMRKLSHYFTPFQTYLIEEAENERGRFDLRIALEILHKEARYRAEDASRQGVFLYQFESLCRNRLRYDSGLTAIAGDPAYDEDWRTWIKSVIHEVGLVDFADLVYLRSEYCVQERRRRGELDPQLPVPVLFGVREGKIARANRRKDPLYLFAALQRQLGYPGVPRVKPADNSPTLIPQLMRRIERLETRIKILEEEQREGLDITQFYQPPNS